MSQELQIITLYIYSMISLLVIVYTINKAIFIHMTSYQRYVTRTYDKFYHSRYQMTECSVSICTPMFSSGSNR